MIPVPGLWIFSLRQNVDVLGVVTKRLRFLFRNEFVNSIFDNFLIGLCEIFV